MQTCTKDKKDILYNLRNKIKIFLAEGFKLLGKASIIKKRFDL